MDHNMMLYPAANPAMRTTKHQQQPLPTKRRRGRPPKDLTAENSPSSISDGIFTTSPAALNSAAALRVGSPETTSPLMRVSPDKRKRNSIDRVTQTGPKSKKSRGSFVEYTPTKPSPLSTKRDASFVSMAPPPSSKTHQKLSEITGKKLKAQQLRPVPTAQPQQQPTQVSQQQQQQQQMPEFQHQGLHNQQFAEDPSFSKIANKINLDNFLLSSPLANLQQPSSFVKQHDQSSDMIFGPGNIPLTPASQFSSMIHSSPIYQNYFGEALTPLIGRKFNFDANFSRIRFDGEEMVQHQNQQQQHQMSTLPPQAAQFNDQQQPPLSNQQRSNSATIIDTIGRNISGKSDQIQSFEQLISSPVRNDDFIKKSYSTASLPLATSFTANKPQRRSLPMLPSSKRMAKKNFKVSLKIGSDGKASITREETDEDAEDRPRTTSVIHQSPIKMTPRATIRPSLMTLSSSPALLSSRDSTINNLKSIILNDQNGVSVTEEEGEDDDDDEGEDAHIQTADSDARNALMRAFKRMP